MPHGRHASIRPHHWVAAAIAVVLALSLATALGWFYRSQDGSTATSTSSPTATTTAASALDACQDVWRAQSSTLDAAGRSLAQWRVHVDAMNQLVAGEITLAQAMAFWSRTRVGAASRVARFEKADGAYADVKPECATRAPTARDSGQLGTCLAGVRARDRAVTAGNVAVGTWKHHIEDMEMLRAGQITPDQASRMWLMSWKQGVRQLDTFARVRRDAADAGAC